MKSRVALIAVAAMLASVVFCSAAAAVAPKADFFGLTTRDRLSADYEAAEMQGLGTHTVRMDIAWGKIAPGEFAACGPETASPVNFTYYDGVFRRAATHQITIIAALSRCTSTRYFDPGAGGVEGELYKAWKVQPGPGYGGGFVWQVVQRYGISGSFWSENPSLPYRPVRVWEVGNEPNLANNNPGGTISPQKYAKFLIDTSATVRAAQEAKSGQPVSATDTKVIIGGLSSAAEGTYVTNWLNSIYSSPSGYTATQFHNAWDGLGWHPYALQGCAITTGGCPTPTMQSRVEDARAALDTKRSALGGGSGAERTLWLTELGWPVMGISGQIWVDDAKQAQFLNEGFNWIYANADAKKIKVAAWYVYRDAPGVTSCGEWACWDKVAGLKRSDGSNRPSWDAFRTQVGGSGDWLRYWKLRDSLSSGEADVSLSFGLRSQRRVVGDWNGDGIDTVGIFNISDATWHLRNSNTPGYPDYPPFGFGTATMLPIAGDWNGDGKDTIGLFSPSDSTWHFRNSLSSGYPDVTFGFGTSTMLPIAGDWNGDGKDTIGLFGTDASWHLRNTLSGGYPDVYFTYGVGSMMPIAGDWNGDGKDTIGLYGSGDSSFHLRDSLSNGYPDYHFFFERGGLYPVAGDWNGDGKDTIGLTG